MHTSGENDDGSGVDGVHGLMAHERPLLQSSSIQRGLQQEGDEGEALHPRPGGETLHACLEHLPIKKKFLRQVFNIFLLYCIPIYSDNWF